MKLLVLNIKLHVLNTLIQKFQVSKQKYPLLIKIWYENIFIYWKKNTYIYL